MIEYRNVYAVGNGIEWSTPAAAQRAAEDAYSIRFVRVEKLFNGVPFCPPVGLRL